MKKAYEGRENAIAELATVKNAQAILRKVTTIREIRESG